MAFGQSSYQKLIADPHASNVLRVFALDRTLLFVGCQGTVQDPNFSQVIEWASEALADSTHRHFLLCRASEAAQLQSVPWLYPVVYGETFQDLVPWLQQLRQESQSPRPSSSTIVQRTSASLLDDYAKCIQQRYARLKLESIDLTGGFYRELDLWRVFVPQTVRPCDDFLPQI